MLEHLFVIRLRITKELFAMNKKSRGRSPRTKTKTDFIEACNDGTIRQFPSKNAGRVDYAIKAHEEITEGKLYNVVIGFDQNLVQCEIAMKKHKADAAFGEDFDYIYRIVTSGISDMQHKRFVLGWY
ncbi:7985_t:CDS:2 [Funneliformis caledonium]|uniref:7985_t:CDS:1 n=1 Tax=Funneliformis caledonium TaxID=1117310 RepID=A0A9N9A5L7_9GLOM|nr:7985_t:CDS:2 [Funneliformis caledonium]